MSGTQHAPIRHSPPHVRKSSGLKAARSAPFPRTVFAGPKITVGGGAKKVRKDREEDRTFAEDDDVMAMSFLQYCAMCEKQIIVPNTSILYCSESCRRIDSIPSPPTVNSEFDSTFQKTNLTELDMRDHLSAHLPALVPRLQPTTIAAVKEAQIPPNFHEGASDLDPTEWKPAEQVVEAATAPPETRIFTPGLSSCRAPPSGASSSSLSNSWKPKLHHRPSSAASIYLSQFYRSNDSLESLKHRSARATTSFNAHVTPVLSDSPTVSSTGSEESLSGTSYELVMRPRTVSGPTTAVTTSPTEEADVGLSDEKQHLPTVIDPSLRSASGSLRELLSGAKKTGVAM